MTFYAVFLIAVALSMDSFAVSVVNGAVLKRVKIWNVIKIAFYFALFQGVMPVAGWFLASGFRGLFNLFDYWVAFILLFAIGAKMIIESRGGPEKIKKTDPLNSAALAVMALATSIDAFAVGAGFAFLEVNIYTASVLIGVTTFIFSSAGVVLGSATGYFLRDKAELAGGIILIAIGFKVLAEGILFS